MSLKSIRTQRGLKQEEVAEYLSITRAAYTNIENGKRQLDSSNLIKLAELFNVSTDAILGRQEPVQTKKLTVKDSELELDEELVNLLSDLSPSEIQRVKDFVSGVIAARAKDASHRG